MTGLITAEQLSERWQLSVHTLANWRVQRIGPKYVKIRSEIRYRMKDIVDYERKNEVKQ